MAKKKPSEYLTEFLNFISGVETEYTLCLEELFKQDRLTQDYLHSLELDNLKCNERSKIATKLMVNRKDRRYFKDRIEELEPILKFISDENNKRTLDKLKVIVGEVRKSESYHENRVYKPRVLKSEIM